MKALAISAGGKKLPLLPTWGDSEVSVGEDTLHGRFRYGDFEIALWSHEQLDDLLALVKQGFSKQFGEED